MLRRLSIVGLLVFGLCGAWSQVPGNGSGQHDKAQDKQETTNPSKPVVVVDSQHGANNQEQGPEKPAKYPWRELLAPANIPNWFLVAVGGITGWFVYRTLKAIKKQADIMESQAKDARDSGAQAARISLATAKAAQKSADASMAQIQFMKDKERARILIREVWTPTLAFKDDSVKPEIPLKITMTVVNDGSRMASNVRAEGHTYFLDYSSIFQDGSIVDVDDDPSDWYRLEIPKIMYPSTHPTIQRRPSVEVYVTHMAGVVEEIYEPLDRSLANAIAKGETCIAIRGEISYEDIFGDAHQTPFHLIWVRDVLNEDGVWVGSQPVRGGWMNLSAKSA